MSSRTVWITNGMKAARVAESSLVFWQLRGWMPMATRADVARSAAVAAPSQEVTPDSDPVAMPPAANPRAEGASKAKPRRDSAETLNEEAIAPHTEE